MIIFYFPGKGHSGVVSGGGGARAPGRRPWRRINTLFAVI